MYRPINRPAISVLVPYRPDNGWRDRVWTYLSRQWAATGWEVITGECPPGPWRKGLAVKDAASRASGDVLVVSDADVTGDGLGEAVDAVLSGAPWAIPHTNVHRLSRNATVAVLAGEPVGGQLEQRPYRGVTGGGMVVLTRDALAECPMDVRFQGWGQEDQAWGLALTTLHGEPPRSTEPLWHLWHEPQDRLSRSTGSMGGRLLLRRYQAASGHRDQMCALLAEEGELDTRESGMYVYRNKNNGQTVEVPKRNGRLDRLGNWELLSSPPEPEPRPEIVAEPAREHVVVNGGGFRPPVVETPSAAPEPVEVPAPAAAEAVPFKLAIDRDWPFAPAGDFRSSVEPEASPATPVVEAPVAPAVADPSRPAVNEPKRVWLAYAQSRGVKGAEALTKTALIRACS